MALDYEKQYYEKGFTYIAGADEAGRGCLLGPVFAAAVILLCRTPLLHFVNLALIQFH